MEEEEVSLEDLESRAKVSGKCTPPKVERVVDIAPLLGIPIEDLPMVESRGGRHLEKAPSEELTPKDMEVMTLLACGVEKTVIANLIGVDRRTIHKMLSTERVCRFLGGAKKRLSALAPLAVEIIHSELVKGNVGVAEKVLKGLALLKNSANHPDSRLKERSTAEEIVDREGKTTRRVTKEREIDG